MFIRRQTWITAFGIFAVLSLTLYLLNAGLAVVRRKSAPLEYKPNRPISAESVVLELHQVHVTVRPAINRSDPGTRLTQSAQPRPDQQHQVIVEALAGSARSLERKFRSGLGITDQKVEEFMFPSNCSRKPINYFVGRTQVNKKPRFEADLLREFPSVKNGHYAPENCSPGLKLAILIPFRDRRSHLYTLLPVLFTILIRQGMDFTIFLIEQVRLRL
ncbi:beta-1,4-galactosyltransferase 1 [Elysia marginata]|uniref:Beta-1,4-galactosyltransferase 1 n=1 Tax=Elysia marginata TaxID=1093978 RepID=A0AAV4FY06_9GAST|nr:beta-1,4-galactosyltransferase 1 [Elysia marginata]